MEGGPKGSGILFLSITCPPVCVMTGLVIGTVEIRSPAQGRRSPQYSLQSLVSLISPFKHTMLTWPETRPIIDRLRVTNRQAKFTDRRRLLNTPIIRVRTDILSVETGLLYMTNLGPIVSVWVTFICRCRLLENLRGQWPVRLEPSFIPLSRATTRPKWLPPLPVSPRTLTVLLMTLVMATWGLKSVQGLRNMTRTPW